MDREDYKKRREAISGEIGKLQFEQQILDRLYIAQSPLKVGDKVVYRGKNYYIYEVKLAYNYDFAYNLTVPKNNGEMPKNLIKGEYLVLEKNLTPGWH